MSIPKDPSYLHTAFYRIPVKDPQAQEKDLLNFAYISWECLNIFKEAFPKRIDTFQENMENFCSLDPETYKKEIFRRQVSYIQSRGLSIEPLNLYEVEDLFHVLEQSFMERNLQAMKICLTVLNSQICPPTVFFNLSETHCQIFETIAHEENFFNDNQILNNDFDYECYYENKKMALGLINKTLKVKNFRGIETNLEKNDEKNETFAQIIEKFRLEETQSFPSQIFQLRESLDLERITYILNELLLKPPEFLKKSQFINTLIHVMARYSKGELGIDSSYLTKYCIFHNRVLKYFFQNIEDEQILTEIVRSEAVSPLSQILQEGILNIMQNTINFDNNEPSEKEMFLKFSISLMEKFASFYTCKDIIKEALCYAKEIIGNYLGDAESGQLMKDLENLGQNLVGFYKRIVVLNKNILRTEERYKEEKYESPNKVMKSHRFLSKKTRDFLQREMKPNV